MFRFLHVHTGERGGILKDILEVGSPEQAFRLHWRRYEFSPWMQEQFAALSRRLWRTLDLRNWLWRNLSPGKRWDRIGPQNLFAWRELQQQGVNLNQRGEQRTSHGGCVASQGVSGCPYVYRCCYSKKARHLTQTRKHPLAPSGTVPLVPSTGMAEKDHFVSSLPVG